MKSRDFRARVLVDNGASRYEVEELLNYNDNIFDCSCFSEPIKFPLLPEAHVATWKNYLAQAQEIGVFPTLKSKLVQLSFPISQGISQTVSYRTAIAKGVLVHNLHKTTGLVLTEPDKLQLIVHSSLAGQIPVIIAGNRPDFVSLIQALTMRNEPKEIPSSMGACSVSGFNNWNRIHQYKQEWQENHPDFGEALWTNEFLRLMSQKELYQDRFIILSRGNYSNVEAADLGLKDDQWQQLSLTIRLEHECTHYFTKRLFGSMRNNVLDELLADYRGIVAAIGHYRHDWFLRFMGLESFPDYRPGGRLENYRGNLSEGSFKVLQSLVVEAAKNLKIFELQQTSRVSSAMMLTALCHLTLEELASNQAKAYICEVLHHLEETGMESNELTLAYAF